MSEVLSPEARKWRDADIERVKRLRLLDDVFMRVVLKDNIPGVQDIVRTILKRDDITVLEVKTQDDLANLFGHGVCLDVLARDAEGRQFNVEIQRSGAGANPKRARYNLSAIDWHSLAAGTAYDQLGEVYIIFITEQDVFSRNRPVYTIDRLIRETGEDFNDGSHILYANGAYEGGDKIGRLMADFRESDPEKMHFASLAEKAGFYKSTEGGLHSMCRIMEEVREEGVMIGREQGREEGWRRAREKMLDVLLPQLTSDTLLHDAQFQGLGITQDEIDAARKRLQS